MNNIKLLICRCGGIGRHKGLKIPRGRLRTGSSPVSGTRLSLDACRVQVRPFLLPLSRAGYSAWFGKVACWAEPGRTSRPELGLFFCFPPRRRRRKAWQRSSVCQAYFLLLSGKRFELQRSGRRTRWRFSSSARWLCRCRPGRKQCRGPRWCG